jgi:hypothetical protein
MTPPCSMRARPVLTVKSVDGAERSTEPFTGSFVAISCKDGRRGWEDEVEQSGDGELKQKV